MSRVCRVTAAALTAAVALAGTVTGASGPIEQQLERSSSDSDGVAEALRGVGQEFVVSLVIVGGFVDGCQTLEPDLRAQCLSLADDGGVDAYADVILDLYLYNADAALRFAQAYAERDANPEFSEDPAAYLKFWHANLSKANGRIFAHLDELEAIIADRARVLASIRTLRSPVADVLLPDAVRETLEAMPVDEMEQALEQWRIARGLMADFLDTMEDIRGRIADDLRTLGIKQDEPVIGPDARVFRGLGTFGLYHEEEGIRPCSIRPKVMTVLTMQPDLTATLSFEQVPTTEGSASLVDGKLVPKVECVVLDKPRVYSGHWDQFGGNAGVSIGFPGTDEPIRFWIPTVDEGTPRAKSKTSLYFDDIGRRYFFDLSLPEEQ